MRYLIFIIIVLILAACGKDEKRLQYAPPNVIQPGSHSIQVVFDRSFPLMSGDIYEAHEFDMNSLFTSVWIHEGLHITSLGYIDINQCLINKGVTGIFYSLEGNKFTFYFIRNDQPIDYSYLWGCSISLEVGISQ